MPQGNLVIFLRDASEIIRCRPLINHSGSTELAWWSKMLTFNWAKMVNLWYWTMSLWQQTTGKIWMREKECFRAGNNFNFLFSRNTIPNFMISCWRALTPRRRLFRPMRRMPRIGSRASSTTPKRRRGREGRRSSPASSVNSGSLRQVCSKENKRRHLKFSTS